MTSRDQLLTQAAQLLRQRAEIDATDLFMDNLTRPEALRLAAAARSAAPASRADPPSATSASVSAAPEPAGPSAGGGALPLLPTSYTELRDAAMSCTRCRLAEGRTNVVFSDGSESATTDGGR